MSSLVFSFQWNIALKGFNHNPSSSIVNEVIRAIFFFFMKIFYTQKKPTKHPSNVYSDIPIRLKA